MSMTCPKLSFDLWWSGHILSLGLQWSQHACCCPMSMTCPKLSLGLWQSGHISSLGLQWSQHVCCYPMIRTCSRLTLCLLWSGHVQSCHLAWFAPDCCLACNDQDISQVHSASRDHSMCAFAERWWHVPGCQLACYDRGTLQEVTQPSDHVPSCHMAYDDQDTSPVVSSDHGTSATAQLRLLQDKLIRLAEICTENQPSITVGLFTRDH